MPDMLVRLYALPPIGSVEEGLRAKGVTARRPGIYPVKRA